MSDVEWRRVVGKSVNRKPKTETKTETKSGRRRLAPVNSSQE